MSVHNGEKCSTYIYQNKTPLHMDMWKQQTQLTNREKHFENIKKNEKERGKELTPLPIEKQKDTIPCQHTRTNWWLYQR